MQQSDPQPYEPFTRPTPPPSFDDEPLPNLNPMPDPGAYDPAELVVCTEHPDELRITGIPVRCPGCAARRDWLLFVYKGHVWIRCRCARQWPEPELTVDDYHDLAAGPLDRYWATFAEAITALGFDGTFKGLYLQ
ncbi:hypothetical protein [Streptomyces sp. SID3343]|uniref:hypothetical protein n=1 Tax=Streptomyces sp. SID3343 TaxID=2690260 RepID=UPI00136F7264|nr:hypothetical protein [Streptomyces sp. SID3343]MYV97320.1 hypothetical protein [Streptomyces sp. SID3343]